MESVFKVTELRSWKSCEIVSLSEPPKDWNKTKIYRNTYFNWETKLISHGHGFKGQGYINVRKQRHTDRRLSVEAHLIT